MFRGIEFLRKDPIHFVQLAILKFPYLKSFRKTVFPIENYLLQYFLSIFKCNSLGTGDHWVSIKSKRKNYGNLFIPITFWVKFVIITLSSDIKKVFPPSQGD
jgi:hypothetical protein